MDNLITAEIEYVAGRLRHGHYELYLSGEDYKKFCACSEEEKKEWIRGEGKIVIDDYRIDYFGDLYDIQW